ncbi:MAG: DUF4129 domain-containing protein [Deinococcus sp.]
MPLRFQETPLGYARRAAKERPRQAGDILAFTREYLDLRYGPPGLGSDPQRARRVRELRRRASGWRAAGWRRGR